MNYFPFKKLTLIAGTMLVAGVTVLPMGAMAAETVTPILISIKAESPVTVATKEVKSDDALLKLNLQIPVLNGMKDTKYQEQLNYIIESHAMKDVEVWKKDAQEASTRAKAAGYTYRPYELYVTYEVKSDGLGVKDGIVSLKVTTYAATGGTGNPRIDTYNVYNSDVAKRVELKDLLGDNFIEIVNQAVEKEMNAHPEYYFKDQFKGIRDSQSFYVQNGDVVVVFPKYSIAPGVTGSPEFRIPTSAVKAGVTVTDKEVQDDNAYLKLHVKLPVIQGMKDSKYQEQMNYIIESHAMKDIEKWKSEAKAASDKASTAGYTYRPYELYVSYELKSNGEGTPQALISLQVTTYAATGGTGAPRVDHYNFLNLAEGQKVEIKDLLGDNFKEIVDQAVLKGMDAEPSKYFKDQYKGIRESQSFYVQNGEVVVVFPKYSIAPGSTGTPEFRIPLWKLNVGGEELGAPVVVDKQGTVLVPVRDVAEKLGYQLVWNEEKQSVEFSKGAQGTSIQLGKNSYTFAKMAPFSLETSPQLINEKTYVPLSFINQILTSTVEKTANGTIVIK